MATPPETAFQPTVHFQQRPVCCIHQSANNLVPGGTSKRNVYIRDLLAGTTALVSVSTDGVDPGNGDSFLPIISANGHEQYVMSE